MSFFFPTTSASVLGSLGEVKPKCLATKLDPQIVRTSNKKAV